MTNSVYYFSKNIGMVTKSEDNTHLAKFVHTIVDLNETTSFYKFNSSHYRYAAVKIQIVTQYMLPSRGDMVAPLFGP